MKLLMAKFRLLARTIPLGTEPTGTSNLEIQQVVQGFERPKVRDPLGTPRGIQNRPGAAARNLEIKQVQLPIGADVKFALRLWRGLTSDEPIRQRYPRQDRI